MVTIAEGIISTNPMTRSGIKPQFILDLDQVNLLKRVGNTLEEIASSGELSSEDKQFLGEAGFKMKYDFPKQSLDPSVFSDDALNNVGEALIVLVRRGVPDKSIKTFASAILEMINTIEINPLSERSESKPVTSEMFTVDRKALTDLARFSAQRE